MHHIVLKYRRFGINRTIEHQAASEWNELNEKQLLEVLRLISTSTKVKEFRLHIVKLLLDLSWFQFKLVNTVQFIQLFDYFRWIEEGISLTRCPIKILLKTYYGPADELSGFTGLEWILADDAYIRYRDGEENALDELIAVLYRPLDPETSSHDKRETFNSNALEHRAKFLAQVDPLKKLAILRFYESCRQEWEQIYHRVFSGVESNAENYGWAEVFLAIAESGSLGDLEKIEQTPITTIFLKMQVDHKNYEQFKAKNQLK
ncbi:MAG: hypothetical protein AAGF85_00705 [Bacteroidota bacterium]